MQGLRFRLINWLESKRGSSNLVNLVITVAVALIIMAFVIPIAMEQFIGANTSGWSASEVAIWNAVPVFGFLAFLIAIIYMAFKRRI